MDSFNHFKEKVHHVNKSGFAELALEMFRFQAANNPIYKSYIEQLHVRPNWVSRLEDIPFLPIQFFKRFQLKTGSWDEVKSFKSSGTTKTGRSEHLMEDLSFYHAGALLTAQEYLGSLSNFEIAALLPSYHDQGDSSLIEMVNHFSTLALPESGFYQHREEELIHKLNNSTNTMLVFGVSYALVDLAEKVQKADWSRHHFVETGGMKGRKKEMTRTELHKILLTAFGTDQVHSEYGMTELMSQAYGANGVLEFPNWCQAMIRDINDPFSVSNQGSGGLNIIDLANIHSCAFIETEDMANLRGNGSFEVLGRFDNSDIRGCSLLI